MEDKEKDFKEAVEKVIDEREERKRASAPSPVKKNKMKHVDMILALIFIAALLIWIAWPSIMTEETEPAIVYPANVVLYSFDDGDNKLYISGGSVWPIEIEIQPDYVSVSFELKNTGDEDAIDVSCFIKCCDQNGTILFAQLFMFGDIRSPSSSYHIQIPATGSYRVPISNETLYITHSIDVRWSPQGVNTYMKLTEV